MREANLMRTIQLALGRFQNLRLFRNNSGTGWVGKYRKLNGSGNVLIEDARPLHAGLCDGSSDLVGWTSLEIKPEHVGKRVAVFTALEIKTDSGRANASQLNFIEQVRAAGGFAGIVRTPEEAARFIDDHAK